MIICAILSLFVIRKITRPIAAITGVIEHLATLDFTVDEKQAALNMRKDETGSMSRAITHLREELGNVVYDLKQQSSTLYETATMLSDNTGKTLHTVAQVEQASHDIAEGATSQADETEAATNNVVTIGTMVEATNTKVNEIHGIVMEMQKDGDDAAVKIRELDEQNEKTKSSIQTIYAQTNETNQSAKKIREATALIASIAEETSLLSLNASIEAARAGEQGRGFAVVASQIQKLAEQSNESTEKIEEIVTLLIDDSEKAVKTMEEVKDIIKQQVAAVEKTDMIFSRVQKGIQNTKQGIDAIAEHTHQMDDARVNVVDVVQNLTAIAEENAASTEQTSASVTQVSTIVGNIANDAGQVKEVAEKLEENISKFKL
jgi:methyl-accepting chemotaxis protein